MFMHLAPDRPLVLASTSKYRRQVLRQVGAQVRSMAPDYEEEHHLNLAPERLVVHLSLGKANSLISRCPAALIIGSDQVAELDGEVLLKPGSPRRARQQLARLAGRTHRLLTGLAVVDTNDGRKETALCQHRMTMRPLTPAQIAAYVELERPVDCAGSYKVESGGLALFSSMEGSDHTGIIGLPVTLLLDLLDRFAPGDGLP